MLNSNRNRESIQDTIQNWQKNFSKNSRFNSIWKVMPGFLTWTIWKERNRRIFQHEYRNTEHAIDTLMGNIKQLIQVKVKEETNEKPSSSGLRILQLFQLHTNQSMATTRSQQSPQSESNSWNYPPVGWLKLNFDGASRGNPGMAGIGGIIRNHKGDILHIYCKALGEGTNNEMEFAALEQGLRILRDMQNYTAVVEGDSALVISVAKRIYGGTKASKATKHWRLAKVTENIAELISGLRGLVFQAVRHKANVIADHLANHGIENKNREWDSYWHQVNSLDLKKKCIQLAKQDMDNANRA